MVCASLLAIAGCGADEGVDEDATVTVYAAAPTCVQAQGVLEKEGVRVGSVQVRVECLPSTQKSGRYDLAQIGANARRASEDSTTVGYIGESDQHATDFSGPILEAAGIAQLPNESGGKAMHKLLRAIGETPDDGAVRESVHRQLG